MLIVLSAGWKQTKLESFVLLLSIYIYLRASAHLTSEHPAYQTQGSEYKILFLWKCLFEKNLFHILYFF